MLPDTRGIMNCVLTGDILVLTFAFSGTVVSQKEDLVIVTFLAVGVVVGCTA